MPIEQEAGRFQLGAQEGWWHGDGRNDLGGGGRGAVKGRRSSRNLVSTMFPPLASPHPFGQEPDFTVRA